MSDQLKCLGRPIGFPGGPIDFCNEPVKLGNRFCYRCHITAIIITRNRIMSLKMSLEREENDLAKLILECNDVET